MTTLPTVLLTARDIESGEQWTWADACPSLEKGLSGDGSITWTDDNFTQFVNRLPPRFAHIEAEDDQGVIQTARLLRRQPPPTDLCTGPVSYSAEGYAGSLRDKHDTNATPYGPVWTGTSRGMTPEAMVTDAVSQLAPSVTLGTVGVSGFTLPDTESFQGRGPADIVAAASAFGAGLSTPFVSRVRNGIFTWGPLDLAPKYETLVADGAILAPTDDASRLYNHVLVLWGNGQYAEWPGTLSYSQIPTQVTLSVNAGAEVKTPAAALQLAQGLYAKLSELEMGWSWNFTIPMGTAVSLVGGGPIYPYRMDCAQVLRVQDFDPENRYGAKHASPEQLVITSMHWDGQNQQLTGTCGEIRDPSQFVRKVMYASNFSIATPFATHPGTVRQVRDAGKITTFGPFLGSTTTSTGAVAVGPTSSPAPIDYAIPPIASEYKQMLITNEAPKPIKIEKGVTGDLATATGLLDTGLVWSDIPPCEIDYYMLTCTPRGTVTVELSLAATTSSGPIVDASGDLTPGTLLLTAAMTGSKFKRQVYATSTTPSTNSKPRNESQSILLYKLTEIASATAWQIVLNGNRIVPGHPDGANTAKGIGKKSP